MYTPPPSASERLPEGAFVERRRARRWRCRGGPARRPGVARRCPGTSPPGGRKSSAPGTCATSAVARASSGEAAKPSSAQRRAGPSTTSRGSRPWRSWSAHHPSTQPGTGALRTSPRCGHRLVALRGGGPRGRCRFRRARRRRGHRAGRRGGGRARTGRRPSRTCAGWSRRGRRWSRWPRRPPSRRRAASRHPRRRRRGRPSTPSRRRRSSVGERGGQGIARNLARGRDHRAQGRGEAGAAGSGRHVGTRWSGGVVRCRTARVDQRTTLDRGTIERWGGVRRCTVEVAERTTLASLGPAHGRP